MFSNLNKNQKFLLFLAIAFTILFSFTAGFILSRYAPFLSTDDFQILLEAYSVVKKHALNELPDSQALEYGMIRGMLEVVNDPFTIFVEPAQHELQTNQLQGKFGGVGARLERDQAGNVLLYPFPDSPASQAGVGDGDRLIAVGDIPITSASTFEEIQAAIRGPIGKIIQITIGKAPEFGEIVVSIKRAEVALPSVTWNSIPENDEVGIIQINIIAATTPQEVENAILNLQSKGVNRYILDLRNNSGGLLQAGIETASLFLKRGVILQQQYKDKDVENLNSKGNGEFIDIPIVVLVNHGSASAAEIIAGAIQSNDRGQIIGSRTYGKDSIQLVFDLSDGSSMHVTAAKWWIPGMSYSIGETGILPDVEVSDQETQQPEFIQLAIEYLDSY